MSHTRRKPVLNIAEFGRQHEAMGWKIRRYIVGARGRANSDIGAIASRLADRAALSLYATNTSSRIAVATVAAGSVYNLAAATLRARKRPIYFLTITPEFLAQPLSQSPTFDHAAAISWCRNQLGDRNYLGIVEASYFSNYAMSHSRDEATIGWHFHALLWGNALDDIRRLAERTNLEFPALIPGHDAMHVRILTSGQMPGRAVYMLKAPLNDSRVYPMKNEVVDPETGEISQVNASYLRIRKRELRPGDAIKMCRVLGDRTIPDLLFANGQGKKLRATILIRGQRRLRIDRRHHLQLLRTIASPLELFYPQ